MLVGVRTVGQREREQLGVDGDAERVEERPAVVARSVARARPVRRSVARVIPPLDAIRSGRADDLAAVVLCRTSGRRRAAASVARQARLEQATSVGAVAFHCDRRERVFDRDILRFGTATIDLLAISVVPDRWAIRRSCHSADRRSRRAAHRGSSVSCPWSGARSARRSPHSGHSPGQSGRHSGAQRQRQHHRVADHLLDVDPLVDHPRQLVGVGGLVGGAVRVGEQLAELDVDLVGRARRGSASTRRRAGRAPCRTRRRPR